MVLAVGAALVAGTAQEGGLRARYTKQEVEIPMRDGVTLFTAVYAPGDASRAAPILLHAHALRHQPLRARRLPRVARPVAGARERRLHLRLPGRARPVPIGRRVRRDAAASRDARGRPTSTRAPTPTTRSTGCSKNVPHHNGRVGMWGISYPGFYAAAALLDAHPALKAVSPQAPIADCSWATTRTTTARSCSPPTSASIAASIRAPAARPTTNVSPPFDYGTRDGYAFYLGLGGLLRLQREARMPAGNTYWDDILAHTTYDDFWKRARSRRT